MGPENVRGQFFVKLYAYNKGGAIITPWIFIFERPLIGVKIFEIFYWHKRSAFQLVRLARR